MVKTRSEENGIRLGMFRLLVILGAGVFLTLLIGGRDAGQTRFGLQGAYDIAALKDAPPPEPTVEVAVVAAPVAKPVPAAAPAPRVTQASFADSAASDAGGPLQTGLTLSLPLVTEPAAAPAEPVAVAAGPAPLRISRILGSSVNVREGPSAKSTVLDRLAQDEAVTVISTDESGWSLIRVEGDGLEGYVATRYLSDPVTEGVLFPSE